MKYSLLKCHPLLIPEQNRRGLRRDQASRRMVALYDYDPRESSPNVDVEVSLTAVSLTLAEHTYLQIQESAVSEDNHINK